MSKPESERELVLASGNQGKIDELEPALAAAGWSLHPQTAFQVTGAAETASTFVENALAKARHTAAETARAALADDSGLIVPALGGAPGVHSARFAGPAADDAANNALLLQRMAEVTDRRAMFCCVLVLLPNADDPLPVIAEGRWRGELATARQGRGGFGYDPLFRVPGLHCTAAELEPAEKNRLSHRARALAALTAALAEHAA